MSPNFGCALSSMFEMSIIEWTTWLTELVFFPQQYSDETANHLAKQLLDGATAETNIAVVSAPSAFVALKNILVSLEVSNMSRLKEYIERNLG